MTETSLLPTDVGAAVELLERACAWDDEPLTSARAQSLEMLTARAVQLASVLRMIWAACTREGTVWETRAYLSRVRTVEFLALTVVDLLTRTGEILARTQKKYPAWVPPPAALTVQSNLEAAREIVAKGGEVLRRLNRPQRPVDEEMIRRSRESLERGEGEAIGDILARLESGGTLVKE